jgi:hypothetical protein
MKSLFCLTLRCMLTVALLTGGVSAWASGATHGAGAALGTASGHHPSMQAESDATPESGKCHLLQEGAEVTSEGDSDERRCCAEQGDCQHESCDCSCPALTLVVPTRLPTAQHLPTPIGLSALPVRSPRNTIDTLLRPPQA